MARRPKPWFRKARRTWFVPVEGVQHNLGPVKGETYERFFQLMRQPKEQKVASQSMAAIADAFLDWGQKQRSPDTYEWYRYRSLKRPLSRTRSGIRYRAGGICLNGSDSMDLISKTVPTVQAFAVLARRLVSIAFCSVLLTAVLRSGASAGDASPAARRSARQLAFFERRVRPLLAKRCFSCHGPRKQEGGLRLDSRAAVLKGGDNGPAIRIGMPDRSLLIQAVRRTGDIKMPPKERLSKTEIDSLLQWIKDGAVWTPDNAAKTQKRDGKSHWAFQPLGTVRPPKTRDVSWPRNPVDRFILAKLERAGLQPSRQADRRTLIRRATFDLTGLPPTPDEVDRFLVDDSPDAFARLVDRLLTSPRYGERWGRHWLDVARYADNKGYVFFEDKTFPWAYTYRDYVVRSLNADLPYDRFIVEQLAADRLRPPRDRASLAALGFLTLGDRFTNNLHDITDDRIDVVTRGLLGLTVTCARCHDHKFDPVGQDDYYALYGVFRSCFEPTVPPLLADPPKTADYETFDKELKVRVKRLRTFVNRKHRELVTSSRKRAAEYLLAAEDARGKPRTDMFMLLVEKGGLNPKMVLRWQLHLERTAKNHDPVWAPWHAFAKHKNAEAAAFRRQAKAVADRLAKPDPQRPINALVRAAFVDRPPASLKDVAARYADLLNRIDRDWKNFLAGAVTAKRNPPTRMPHEAAESLRRQLYGKQAPSDVPMAFGWGFLDLLPDRPAQAEYQKLLKAVESWISKGKGAQPRAMSLVDAPVPHEPRVFLRGNPNRPGQAVPRRFPRVLGGTTFQRGSGRLELARAIASPDNPLTARVIVNRVWQHHFVNPLVSTPSDFGLRSDPPSHPELLDSLAADFIRHGWSLKWLHREMMLSSTYQQSSADTKSTASGLAVDADNRLLWKMNRRRLEFEELRDSLLAVSGSMQQRIGGPPAKMFGENYVPRRTVYGFVDRLNLPGLLRTFDFPAPAATTEKRDTTTIAPQALFLMNHPFARETARRVLGRPDIAGAKNIDDRTRRLCRLLFNRQPTKDELALAVEFLRGDTGKAPAAAAWETYIHGLLMTNEFTFVD